MENDTLVRLIDYAALREKFQRRLDASNQGMLGEAYYSACLELIDEAPAVDAVELRHAMPVKFYSDPYTNRLFTTCSACDGKIGPKDKWCKHCGARMDGEDGDT